ncbi:MAG TPA: PilZ domain-containing protein [Rhizomicrobium sp.]|nr:PilZ domain-containing protein [Rhizomicrobium sp.]
MAADKDELVAKARAERRRYKRVPVALSGRLFVPSESREAHCKIADMSPGGAHIACEIVPPQGAHVVVYIDGFGRFEGIVARPAEGAFGIQFNCSQHKRERVAEQLTLYLNGGTLGESSLRRHDREPTKGLARFTRANGEVVNCEVLDLSLSGVSLATDVRPPVGEFVLIGQMAGRVARHHETGIGIEFVAQEKPVAEPAKPKLFVAR